MRGWQRVIARALGLKPRSTFSVTLQGGPQFVVRGMMDIWILKETVLDREYEQGGISLQDGWTIVDVGAGLGDFSVSVAHRFPRCAVYAYEPFPESFELLRRNIDLNHAQNVRPFPIAIGATSGTLRLNTSFKEAVQHSTVVPSMQGDRATTVRCASLSEIFGEHGIKSCDLLKIDCEGAEYDILMNAAPETLGRIRHICMEYHDGVTKLSHRDLERHLSAHHFEVMTKRSLVHQNLGLLFATNRSSDRDETGRSTQGIARQQEEK